MDYFPPISTSVKCCSIKLCYCAKSAEYLLLSWCGIENAGCQVPLSLLSSLRQEWQGKPLTLFYLSGQICFLLAFFRSCKMDFVSYVEYTPQDKVGYLFRNPTCFFGKLFLNWLFTNKTKVSLNYIYIKYFRKQRVLHLACTDINNVYKMTNHENLT